MELGRVSRLSTSMAMAAVSEEGANPPQLDKDLYSVTALISAISQFNQKIAQQNLDPDISDILPSSIRVSGYLNEIARLSTRLVDYHETFDAVDDTSIQRNIFQFKKDISELLNICQIDEASDIQSEPGRQLLHKIEHDYQSLKSDILHAASSGRLVAEECVTLLDALSHLRRLAEQAEKASTYWSSMLPIHNRQPLLNSAIRDIDDQ